MRRERADSRVLTLHVGSVTLEANLNLPEGARGLVVLAQARGNGRDGPARRRVVDALTGASLGTVVFDLLAPDEERARADEPHAAVARLAGRLVAVLDRLHAWAVTRGLPLGLFGSGPGGAAALLAAARRPDLVAAVASCGARLELTSGALEAVRAPTLLLVGALDEELLGPNRGVAEALPRATLAIVRGTTRRYDDEGAFEDVARRTRDFFVRHVRASLEETPVRLPFADRPAAGRQLAERLRAHAQDASLVVLGLPSGGVPVAHEVARALAAPEDVLVVRKLVAPSQPELAMGAIAPGIVALEPEVARHVSGRDLEAAIGHEELERRARERRFRARRGPLDVRKRTVLLVDDGVATGSTMRAAVSWVRAHAAARVIVAVPVGAREALDRLARQADEVVCLAVPPGFGAVGEHYQHFEPVGEDEVVRLLASAPPEAPRGGLTP